jgi:IS5 family transposase
MKLKFGFVKVRYRGLKKNAKSLATETATTLTKTGARLKPN